MTQPNQADAEAKAKADAEAKANQGDSPTADTSRRYRPGQVATFRVNDPTTGDEFTGHGLVLKVDGDQADVAVIGTAHVRVALDKLAPAKVDEVPNPLPAPAPAEGSGE